MRVMIIDDHEISRAAIRALLRAEGADVIADIKANAHALAAARALNPEVVIIDVTPAADTGLGIARLLCGLSAPPIVILTSSADRARLGAEVNRYPFIAKADITAAVIAALANTCNTPDRTLIFMPDVPSHGDGGHASTQYGNLRVPRQTSEDRRPGRCS
jgi:chemotaxis response regulator CheB